MFEYSGFELLCSTQCRAAQLGIDHIAVLCCSDFRNMCLKFLFVVIGNGKREWICWPNHEKEQNRQSCRYWLFCRDVIQYRYFWEWYHRWQVSWKRIRGSAVASYTEQILYLQWKLCNQQLDQGRKLLSFITSVTFTLIRWWDDLKGLQRVCQITRTYVKRR